MSSNKMATKSDLQEMYSRILPYLGGSADAGFTPIGTIIAVFSETAPANYLICDGATYNKADYPELAAHLLALTTHSQYEVSGDSTKFKVPDLRGEFLRGTGTNGYSGEGNGANVGVHQASTEIPAFQVWNNSNGTSKISVTLRNTSDGTSGNVYLNPDSLDNTPTAQRTYINTADVNRINQAQAASYSFAARPTNTSVLFCIAVKDIYLDSQGNVYTKDQVYTKSEVDASLALKQDKLTNNFVFTSLGSYSLNLPTSTYPNLKSFATNAALYNAVRNFTQSLANNVFVRFTAFHTSRLGNLFAYNDNNYFSNASNTWGFEAFRLGPASYNFFRCDSNGISARKVSFAASSNTLTNWDADTTAFTEMSYLRFEMFKKIT